MSLRSKKVDQTTHENAGPFTREDDNVVKDANEDTD